MKNIKLFLSISFISTSMLSASAQDVVAAVPKDKGGAYEFIVNNMPALLIGLVLVFALLAIYKLLSSMINMQELKIYEKHGLDSYLAEKKNKSWWKSLDAKLTDAIPLEQEQDIMLDHDYDGIRELDNKLPPWWVWLFNITIFIAVVYMGYYHFSGNDWSSKGEWEQEMATSKAEVDAYLATKTDLISEKDVTILNGEADIAAGKKVWTTNCVACHGADGQGGIGPNMTDNYWLHGCDIKDIFKTIKYGVPAKGMIAWKTQLKPKKMQQVSSYILTLQGTTPPNPKAKQGEECNASKG